MTTKTMDKTKGIASQDENSSLLNVMVSNWYEVGLQLVA